MKFRKKPVIVEAKQFIVTNWKEIETWSDGKVKAIGNWKHENDVVCMGVTTLEGDMFALPNDWIVKEPFATDYRKFYPCKPDIFEQTYEAVADAAI